MPKLESVSLVQQAAGFVRQRILAGAMKPGDRLREEQLASELGISRPPLREALRLLQSEGLVESQPRRGVIVSPLREQDAWEILRDHTWSVSWRTAGGIVADIRGSGDYLDWYCSGMMTGHPSDGVETLAESQYVREGMVTEEIQQDLAQIEWYPVVDQ